MVTNSSGREKNSGIEAQLFRAADKLRKNLEPSDYKHVVLGLIFLRHVSHSFEVRHEALLGEDPETAEDPDEYIAENVFWVPKEARWTYLQAQARLPDIGKLIDGAMIAIEASNPSLNGVLVKDFNRPSLDKVMLGELIDLISSISLHQEGAKAHDLLGKVYEYFLGGFAGSEGKRGGEFYTPRSIVRVLVEMLEPFPDRERGVEGLIYDPCCGSGGMFVQTEKFLEAHGGRTSQLAIYGQESNYTTWRLCKMNLAVRSIDGSGIAWNNEGTLHKNEWHDKKFDFILANPPFNDSDWGGERIREDARWKFGMPPPSNANFAWLQHILWHLSPNGTAGIVLANGSMSSQQLGEGEIRKAMVEADLVDCMIALPGQLFYSTQIPACLWILAKNKSNGGFRDRRGEVLFIDVRRLGHMVDRARRELTDGDIARVAAAYRAWRGEKDAGNYADVPGFCKCATLDEIRDHGHVLTPSRYVGAETPMNDGEEFEDKTKCLVSQLHKLQTEGARLDVTIAKSLTVLGLWDRTK